MAAPEDASRELWEALLNHFNRTSEKVNVEQIQEMTGLDRNDTEKGLRILHEEGRIDGIMAAEGGYPVWVTRVIRSAA